MNPTDRFPRLGLGQFPTPIHRLARLEQALGGGHILLKRDDLSGFALAGNKTRPLEFLVAAAAAAGSSVVVSGGAPKSNFIAAVAAAARATQMECELLVSGPELVDPPITLRLARSSGAHVHFTGGDRDDLDGQIEAHAADLNRDERRAYSIPRGGACGVGALGFANAAFELADQGIPDNATVVLPVGSGSSISGLNSGRAAVGSDWRIVGVSVSRPIDEMRRQTSDIARACSELLDSAAPSDAFLIDASSPGMGTITDEDRAIADLAYATEGLLLDPFYGVKALLEVKKMVAAGTTDPIVLWFTGGLPAAVELLTGGDGRA